MSRRVKRKLRWWANAAINQIGGTVLCRAWHRGHRYAMFPWWRAPRWAQWFSRRVLGNEWEMGPEELKWAHEAIAEYRARAAREGRVVP